MNHWFSRSEIPLDMTTKPEYEHILHSRLQSISTTVSNLASIRFWKHYTNDIEGQIEELSGDSCNDLDIEELERDLPYPTACVYSKANIDISEGEITNFITTLIHNNALWDLGFHINYRKNNHRNNNY